MESAEDESSGRLLGLKRLRSAWSAVRASARRRWKARRAASCWACFLVIAFGFGKGAGASVVVVDADFDAEALLMVGAGLAVRT